jgi:hypothetical protein
VSDPLDPDLDPLYKAPADEFVAARNALSDRLRKAGDKASAARVKALKRPTPAAWLLNQVWFTHADLFEQASAATQRLRELHQRGGHDMRELSAANDAQRRAMNAVLDAAKQGGQQAGIAVEAALQRKLFTTLQAWLAGGAGEPPGRMAHEIEASGFDAVAALGMPAPMIKPAPEAASAPPPAASSLPAPRAPDAAAIERAGARLAESERRASEAARELERLRARAAQELEELARARRTVQDAEATLVKLRAQVSEREAAVRGLSGALEAAEQVAGRAHEEEARARAALAALTET